MEAQVNEPQQIHDLRPLVPQHTEPLMRIENILPHGLLIGTVTHSFFKVKFLYPSFVN